LQNAILPTPPTLGRLVLGFPFLDQCFSPSSCSHPIPPIQRWPSLIRFTQFSPCLFAPNHSLRALPVQTSFMHPPSRQGAQIRNWSRICRASASLRTCLPNGPYPFRKLGAKLTHRGARREVEIDNAVRPPRVIQRVTP
jgi:hypothetical protein